jgi:hypothetical protein
MHQGARAPADGIVERIGGMGVAVRAGESGRGLEPKETTMNETIGRRGGLPLLGAAVGGALLLSSIPATAQDATAAPAPQTTATPPPPAPQPPPQTASSASTPPTTTSALLSAQPSQAVEDLPTTETKSAINRPLMTTGIILLGGSYAASAVAAYTSERSEDQKNLYYPVAGPWMDLANRDCNARPCSNEGLDKALLIADGVAQGLGAIGVVTSLFIPEKTTRHWYLIGDDDLHGGPTRVGTGYGLGAAGRF